MAFWWVNHKQTREHEIRGGYLWSPCRNANGVFNQSYENMRHARVGDIVFSFANGQIGAIGRVTVAATPCPKPTEFGNVGDYWSNEGWLVEAEFVPLASHDPESCRRCWRHMLRNDGFTCSGIVASHGSECWLPMSRNIQTSAAGLD